MNLLGAYRNGNYAVLLCNDGTKIRTNSLDNLTPEFPESIDMKISDRCDMGCPMCHEQSTKNGTLANLNHPLLDSLHPYTELALGGGNIFEHPGLLPFLARMRNQGVICNATVHVEHFNRYWNEIYTTARNGFLHGVGISINEPPSRETIDRIKLIPNAVVHVIAGVVNEKTIDALTWEDIKLLILGYKDYGRGTKFLCSHSATVNRNIKWLEDNFDNLKCWFPLVSFDNLALEQLNIKDKVSPNEWERSYMGDDGSFTMYVDLVKEQYAVSSISERHDIFSSDIRDLFKAVRRETHGEDK